MSAKRDLPRHLRTLPLGEGVNVEYLAQRYGARRRLPGLILVCLLLGAPFVGWVAWVGYVRANEDLRWTTTGFSGISDTSVTVEFDVFKPGEESVRCLVRALDSRGVEVGRAEVPVEQEQPDVHVVYALNVTARPSSAFVDSCELV